MPAFERIRDEIQAELRAHLPESIRRLNWDAERLAAHQQASLRRLVGHARSHSQFHAERLKGIDPDRLNLEDLATLPAMTKAEMMARFDATMTNPGLTLRLVEQALEATADVPTPLLDRYFAFASGGSSGVRGVFVYDIKAMADFVCAMLRPLEARLAATGGPPPGGLRAAIVAAGSAVHVTGCAPAMSAGHHIAFTAVPVTLPFGEVVARLNALQPQVVMGYPSMLARLAHEQIAGRLAIRPLAMSATSETLTPELRGVIESSFEMPLANTFGSSEGLVGHSAPGETALTFNSDMCLVELVDADNQPVPPGVASAKVLMTNLVNLAQPLIRYELSDRFVQTSRPGTGYLRAEVEGRSDDVLRFGPLAIHPHVLRSVLVRYPQVRDYQVRQTSRGVEISILLAGRSDLRALERALRDSLATAGLAGAEVSVQAVTALAAHPETGKLRRIVPLQAEPLHASAQ